MHILRYASFRNMSIDQVFTLHISVYKFLYCRILNEYASAFGKLDRCTFGPMSGIHGNSILGDHQIHSRWPVRIACVIDD